MQSSVSRRLSALALTLALAGCATVERNTPPEPPPDQKAPATTTPGDWLETDAVVVLENLALEGHLREALITAASEENFSLYDITLDFSGEAIGLRAHAKIEGENDEQREALVEGAVRLSFSGDGLSWQPEINRVEAQPADPDWNAERWRQRIEDRLLRNIVVARNNRLGFQLQPPDAITLGANLPGLSETGVERRFALDGAYTVASSRSWAFEQKFALALDLEFVPGISHCTADFSISRSTFAGRIVNREPRDIEHRQLAQGPELHYFTEVSEAKRNLTLVHYWFADGRAVGITELPVEPSARWRTWSSLPIPPGTARNIEVFAADRDSGCIVDASHIEVSAAELFDFEAIARGFSILDGQPDAGAAQISAVLLAESLDRSLGESRFALRFGAVEIPEHALSGQLDSLAGLEFSCEWRDCNAENECSVDFSRCERKQDTRECTTCLFHNPLNNRCMSERVDQDCEERKTNANARYETSWEGCMNRETSLRDACERRGQVMVEACTQRGEAYLAACESHRELLASHTTPLATVSGNAHASGGVTLSYSGLHVVGNLERLKGQLVVEPDLTVQGKLQFSPDSGLGDLASCLENWGADFQTRADRRQPPKRLTAPLLDGEGAVIAAWPGMTVPLNMNQEPLDALLGDQPDLFSACSLGLNAAEISARLAGDGYYLRGLLPLDLEPGAARISLPEVTGKINGRSFSAAAEVKQGQLQFKFGQISSASQQIP